METTLKKHLQAKLDTQGLYYYKLWGKHRQNVKELFNLSRRYLYSNDR